MKLTALVGLAIASTALAQGPVKLAFLSEGAAAKLGSQTQSVTLSTTKPGSIKKLPADLEAPLFAEIPFGPKRLGVILDEPDGKPSRLFVDGNANGDLSDDPPAEWTAKKTRPKPPPKSDVDDTAALPPEPEGKEYTSYSGGAKVRLLGGNERLEGRLAIFRFDKTDPLHSAERTKLHYYRDYAWEGSVKLGGKDYKAILADDAAVGDFRGKSEKAGSPGQIALYIDADDDGKFDTKSERFDIRKPFNVGGTTYEIQAMAQQGNFFRIAKSDKFVEAPQPAAPVPGAAAGKKATEFTIKDFDGATVKFPSDYKGKLVMLDFWATWCHPCMGEVPGLVAAYKKHHDRGFEVLGVTLDKQGDAVKLNETMGQHGMTWRQIFDGKGWNAQIAQLYEIHSIPSAFLVDGDTGEIVASGGDLRGGALDATITKALAKKKGSQ